MNLKYIEKKQEDVSLLEFYPGFFDNSIQWKNSSDKCLHIFWAYFLNCYNWHAATLHILFHFNLISFKIMRPFHWEIVPIKLVSIHSAVIFQMPAKKHGQ